MDNSKHKDLLMQFGDSLRVLRLQKNLSQQQVAFELGTSRAYYQRIEYGKSNPGLLHVYKLADIFEISVSELLPEF